MIFVLYIRYTLSLIFILSVLLESRSHTIDVETSMSKNFTCSILHQGGKCTLFWSQITALQSMTECLLPLILAQSMEISNAFTTPIIYLILNRSFRVSIRGRTAIDFYYEPG